MESKVGPPVEVGPTPGGFRRFIPILGGSVSGSLVTGAVLPGGADYQLVRTDTLTCADAKYVIETDERELIFVENIGTRTGILEDLSRIRLELPVDPSRIYFRSTPRFETCAARLEILNTSIFVGVGSHLPGAVVVDVFRVN
ncbi:DUF3237 family protein [Microbacterium sp. CPCC 204701]|uniref:DUF3237 family protein n=1 Tax=Microbacterium sp. CPCC 204701 TaxID=2493084 RepID=UPI000FDB8ED5|nr:DUF3237 family protein [Microbacterium sp. CPCC 204701]